MYPRNAATPPRISVGPVVLIADGTVQTATVLVKVTPEGGSAGASGGTISFVEGIVHYVPTQAETDFTAFTLTAHKADCIPATVTVVTTATATAGKVDMDSILGTVVTEGGAGRLAGSFTKLYDVATPALVASDVMRGTDGVDTSTMRGTDGVDTATMRGTDGVDTATMRGTDDAALATALAITDIKIDRNADLGESRRGHHTWQGNSFYVDPANGNDSTGDGSRALPYATIQAAHDDLVTDSNHDVIFLVSGAAGITTHTVAATTTISKRYTLIRGPGRDFIITRTGTGPTIAITGDGVELSGFQLGSPGVSATSVGVLVTAVDFVAIHNCWILDTQGDGVHISRGSNCQIFDNKFDGTGVAESGQAIHISGAGGAGNADENIIQNNIIANSVGDAITIDDGTTDATTIRGNSIRGSGGWGIVLTASSDAAHVYENRLASNTSGNIDDGGTNTTLQDNVALDPFELGAVWVDTVNGVAGTEYPIGTEQQQSSSLAVAKTIADARNMTRFEIGAGSSITFATDMDGYTIDGSNYSIDFNDQDSDSLRVTGATLSGTLTASGSVGFIQCRVTDATSLPSCGMGDCTMLGDIILTGTFYLLSECKSVDSPSISLENVGSQTVKVYDYEGALEVKSMKAGDNLVFTGGGHLTIASDCTGGTITLRKFVEFTDNVVGGFVVAGGVINDETRYNGAGINAILVDTAEIGTAGAGLTNINLPDQAMNITGNLSGSVGSVAGNVAGTVASVVTKTGYVLAATGLDSIVVEVGLNARQALAINASASGGKLSGAATTTITILGAGVATTRILATVDEDGNRSAVTLTPPA
jgi:hypothetical protein